MTPNLGAGGNAAIESAAALANSLSKLSSSNPSINEVRKALSEFHAKRRVRANLICDAANQLTRIEALATITDRLIALAAIPRLGDFLTDITTDGIVGAELLEALPPPARSLAATMPYNPEQGIGKHEKKWVRALYALPILAFLYGAQKTMAPTLDGIPKVEGGISSTLDLGGQVVPLCLKYTGHKAVDDFLALYAGIFTPSIGGQDPASRMQMIAFLADIVPVQVILLIEGVRRGNFTTVAHLL
jgi:hypothetical protein